MLLVLRARALSDSVVLVVFAVITVLMAVDDLWNLHLRFGAVIAHQLGLTGALGVDGAGWGAISVWLWALAAAIVAVGSAYRRSATGPRRLARGLILGTALLSLSSVGSTPLAALVDAPTNPAATWLLAALGTLLGLVSCALLLTVCLTEVDDEEYLTFDRRSTVTGSA